MENTQVVKRLQQSLFGHSRLNAYAILDGASVDGLLDQLYSCYPEFVCLYRGELAPDMAEVAPYLIQLEQGHRFTQWLLNNYFGHHWGIFAVSAADIHALRKHFRTFLMVQGPDGKPVYFRYYDPRVLRLYLPTCNEEETLQIFGPVQEFLLEDDQASALISYDMQKSLPQMQLLWKEEVFS